MFLDVTLAVATSGIGHGRRGQQRSYERQQEGDSAGRRRQRRWEVGRPPSCALTWAAPRRREVHHRASVLVGNILHRRLVLRIGRQLNHARTEILRGVCVRTYSESSVSFRIQPKKQCIACSRLASAACSDVLWSSASRHLHLLPGAVRHRPTAELSLACLDAERATRVLHLMRRRNS